MKLKLILPTKKFVSQYIKSEKAILKEGHNISGAAKELIENGGDYSLYKKRTDQSRSGKNLPKGRVPSTIYWAVMGNKIVGSLQIRHRLNKDLRIMHGNIGYSVIPSERGKGYATEMLKLALRKAKLLGLKKVLLTCHESNLASRKVIENNKGVLTKRAVIKKVPVVYYWITL